MRRRDAAVWALRKNSITKARKDESTKKKRSSFVLSSFRAFVIRFFVQSPPCAATSISRDPRRRPRGRSRRGVAARRASLRPVHQEGGQPLQGKGAARCQRPSPCRSPRGPRVQ